MRLPYIDSQTGVAQRHYNSERLKRERMPGRKMGQIYTYPQKHWRKKTYQYLKYFMQPKRFDPESEMHTISQVENPSAASSATTNNIPPNEDSNTSGGQDNKGNGSFEPLFYWQYFSYLYHDWVDLSVCQSHFIWMFEPFTPNVFVKNASIDVL